MQFSPAEIDALLDQRLIASLATLDPDGRIHLVPMWFRHVENTILIPTSHRTRKAQNARRHPYVSVMIQEARPGMDLKGVLIRGPVEVIEGAQARALNRSIHLRYVTAEGLAQEAVARSLTEGDDITLRVAMEEVTSWNIAGTEAARALRASGQVHPLD